MSIFITLLAFKNVGEDVITYSKIAILIASFVAGTMGFFWLKFSLKIPVQESLTPQKE
jgi:NhaA family Na+:H+ antiporter